MKTFGTPKHIQISQGILRVLAVFAILAGLGALADLSSGSPDARVADTWRMIGFFTFAGLFDFLAYKPTENRSLWVIIIANKLALTLFGFMYIGKDYAGSMDLITFDGMITILLVVASVFAGVWRRSLKKATKKK